MNTYTNYVKNACFFVLFVYISIVLFSPSASTKSEIKKSCPINDYDVKNMCHELYVDNKNKHYIVIKNLLSKNYCNKIINIAEEYANKNTWMTDRHTYYPTTDNEITKDWEIYEDMTTTIKTKIYNEIEKLYRAKKQKLTLKEIFVVKYSMDGQQSLEYHQDGSEFSFIIALNNDYSGGGTHFKDSDKLINLDIGDCLVFSGRNIHKGNTITDGKRYILTGFINYGDINACELYMKACI